MITNYSHKPISRQVYFKVVFLLVFIASLTLSGCGKESKDNIVISGKYVDANDSTSYIEFSRDSTAVITHNGSTVTGTYRSASEEGMEGGVILIGTEMVYFLRQGKNITFLSDSSAINCSTYIQQASPSSFLGNVIDFAVNNWVWILIVIIVLAAILG